MNSKYDMNNKPESGLATVFAMAAIMLTGIGAMVAVSQTVQATSPSVQEQIVKAARMPAPQKTAQIPVKSNECVMARGSAASTYRCPKVVVMARRTVKNVEVASSDPVAAR